MTESLPNTEIILHILLAVGVIVIFAKYLGVLSKKVGIPQVAGMIIAGLLLRFLPMFQNFGGTEPNVIFRETNQFISYMAEIGVVLIMFSAGLGTNLSSLVKSGPKATIMALAGVIIPMLLGAVVAFCFFGFDGWGTQNFYKCLFIGCILTATSVSITVAALKELGKLKTNIGQIIVSTAIIDDVFGIIALTVVLGVSSGSGGYLNIILKTAAFFLLALVVGIPVYKLFKWYDKRHPRSRRIPIYALGLGLIFAFCAEEFFGIADITGAYIAGIVLCNVRDSSYMESKIDINSYMFFSPIFFASIGLKTDLSGMSMDLLWFSIAFVIIGCVSKIISCGGVARILGYNKREAIQIGLGMMVRGEVALIVATKGLSVGLIDSKYFTAVILLIIVSSMTVPILLKKAFSENKPPLDENSIEGGEVKSTATPIAPTTPTEGK